MVDLLKQGLACPKEGDKKGSTPLHFACGLYVVPAEGGEAGGTADNQGRGGDNGTVSSYKLCWPMEQT